VTSSTCRVKWYPGKGGAFKFRVEYKKGDSESSESWQNAFLGPENIWKSATLSSTTKYCVRIIALNQQDYESEPSDILEFKTYDRGEIPTTNVNEFTKECTADICVGDTILFTERLFSKGGITAPGGDATGLNHNRASKTHIRMDMSVTSFGSRVDDAPQGVYVGERTVAAHVVRDNFRSVREISTSSNVGTHKFNQSRLLGLEVIWQRTTPKETSTKHDLKRGDIIERYLSQLEQFEVYRKPWLDEKDRLNLRNELDLLEDNYVFNPHVPKWA